MTCQLTISKEGERTILAVAKGIKKNLLLSWLIIQLTEEGTEKVNIRTAAFTSLGFGFHVLPIVFIPKPLLISAVAETVKAVKLARLDKLLDSAIRDYLTSLPAGEQKEAGVVN